MRATCTLIFFLILFAVSANVFTQTPITSIVASNTNAPTITFNNIKGAGIKYANGTFRSNWDSTSSNYTVNYNTSATADIVSLTQFMVAGQSSPTIKFPVNSFIRVRRKANTYVPDTSNHFNFWATYSSVPADFAASGTFNFTAPEIIFPEDAFASNSINSGYDNIFSNTIDNVHSGNIERIDFIIPAGLKTLVAADTSMAGIAVFDRGVGDAFKIAAILSVDNNNNPLTYGPLVTVAAANYGPGLRSTSFNYCIITHDPKYNNQSRPSAHDNQNICGVYVSLGKLGITIGQGFYGYSLFGPDVVSANPDWRTYPNNSTASSQLDPLNVMGIFRGGNSILATPLNFHAEKRNDQAYLYFEIYNNSINEYVAIERSFNGQDFTEIQRITVDSAGTYKYTDQQSSQGIIYYRLRLVEKDGSSGYSEVRKLQIGSRKSVTVYPNPAKKVITIEIPASWEQHKVSATLIDINGKIIQRITFNSATLVNNFVLTQASTGIYFLNVVNHSRNELYIQPVLLQK